MTGSCWQSAVVKTSLQNFHTHAAAHSQWLQEWRDHAGILFNRWHADRHAKGLSADFLGAGFVKPV
jgi:hypothetical protein